MFDYILRTIKALNDKISAYLKSYTYDRERKKDRDTKRNREREKNVQKEREKVREINSERKRYKDK